MGDTTASIQERFPFQEDEIDILLRMYREMTSSSSSSSSNSSNHVAGTFDKTLSTTMTNLLPARCVSTLLQQSIDSSFCFIDSPLNKFLEGISILLGRRGPRPVLDTIWSCCNVEGEIVATKIKLWNWIYRISKASCWVLSTDSDTLLEVEESIHIPNEWQLADVSSRSQFIEWTTSTFPQLYAAVATLFHSILLPNLANGKTPVLRVPKFDKPSAILTMNEVSLALMSEKFQGHWRRLYNNLDDGSSFELLQKSLIGYQGPTTILIQTTRGEVFGYFTECPWKLSSKWFGAPGSNVSHFYDNADSFLFTLVPNVHIYPATGCGKWYQYLHIPASHQSQQMKGLCIGGIASNCPRIHLTTDLNHCKATSIDSTYENGLLLHEGHHFFDAGVIEVYATSVIDVHYKRNQSMGQLQTDMAESHRIHIATVDKTQFLDMVSGFIRPLGVAHLDSMEHRHD